MSRQISVELMPRLDVLPSRAIPTRTKSAKLVRERRDVIIRAAMTVFDRKGYPLATMEDIAAEGGVDKRTLYEYYGKKQDLLYAAMDRYLVLMHSQIRNINLADDPPLTRLKRMLSWHAKAIQQEPHLILFLYRDMRYLGLGDLDLIMAEVKAIIAEYQAVLADAMDRGQIESGDPALLGQSASVLLDMIGLHRWALRGYDAADIAESIFVMLTADHNSDTTLMRVSRLGAGQ